MTLPTLIVEFAFTVGAGSSDYLYLSDTERGLLGTGRLAPDDLWVDVTADVVAFTVNQSAQRFDGPTIRYEAGQATIRLKDLTRDYDPTNLDGPYVSAGVTQVIPMRAVRIRAVWNGTTYPLFRGFVDAWNADYSGEPRLVYVDVLCTDAISSLADFDGEAGSPVGASELAGARVNRILDNADWPASDRMIDAGVTTLQATTLGANALAELQLVSDTELGEGYVDEDGKVVFRDRHASLVDSRSAISQATFGDAGSELPYAKLTPVYDKVTVKNRIRATRVGGAMQTVDDLASQETNRIRTYDRSDLLMETDDAAAQWANAVLYINKDAEYHFGEIEIRPLTAPATLFPEVLGRKFGDRITIKRRPPGGGDPISKDAFIRGRTHAGTPGSWVTTWALQSATRYAFLTLGNASLGVLGSNALAY